MTQDEKAFVLRDLCARLPYGVKVQVDFQSDTYSPIVCKVCSVECAEIGSTFIGVETSPDTYNEFREFLCKPYLFPLSSMTEEQSIEYMNLCERYCPASTYSMEIIDWYNKNHFDYRGLIEKGLAIDATDKNIY